MRASFYLPRHYLPSAEKQRAWEKGEHVTLEQSGKIACAQCWIFQTWALLKRSGFATELVHEMPDEGIVISLTGCLPSDFRTRPQLFVAGIVADGLPHPGAHVQILQNSAHAKRFPGAAFMPLWPQPNIVPRNTNRGGTFERVAFFGDEGNLAAELRDPRWREKLSSVTGAALEIRTAARWHDYSDVDAVIAIRDFRGARHLHKPATKLCNAWLAGVPFVGGADSAYAADGHPGTDYLVARSPDEALTALENIRNDSSLRTRLVAEGVRTAQNFSVDAITARWRALIEDDLRERASKLASRPKALRRCDAIFRRLTCFADRVLRD